MGRWCLTREHNRWLDEGSAWMLICEMELWWRNTMRRKGRVMLIAP